MEDRSAGDVAWILRGSINIFLMQVMLTKRIEVFMSAKIESIRGTFAQQTDDTACNNMNFC